MSSNEREKDQASGGSRVRMARHASLNLLADGSALIAGVVSIKILVTALPDAQFAVLSLAWTTMALFNLFDLGLGRALTRVVAQSLAHGHGLPFAPLRRGLLILLAVGLFAGIVLEIAAPWLTRWLDVPQNLGDSFSTVLRLLALSLPVVVLTSGLRGILEGAGWFAAAAGARCFTSVATYLVPVALLPFTQDLICIVALIVAVRFAGALIHGIAGFMAFKKHPPKQPLSPDGNSQGKEILAFGGWITAGNLASSAAFYVDRLLLTRWNSLESAAYYGTPCDMIIRLLFIPAAVGSVLFPELSGCVPSTSATARTSRAADPGRQAAIVVRRAGRLLLAVLFPVALALGVLAPEIVRVWLGQAWVSRSAPALQVMAAVLLVGGMSQLGYTLIQASGRPRWTAWAHLAELPLHIAVLAWAVPRWGVMGATWSLALRILLEHLTWTLLSGRLVPAAAGVLWRISFGAALGATAIVVAATSIPNVGIRLAITGVGFAACTTFLLNELRTDRAARSSAKITPLPPGAVPGEAPAPDERDRSVEP